MLHGSQPRKTLSTEKKTAGATEINLSAGSLFMLSSWQIG